MQILPNRSANSAGDTHVMLEAGPSTLDSLRDQSCHDRPTLDPEPAVVKEFQMTRRISDYQPTESFIANQYVGAEAENEILYAEISCSGDSPCQIIGRCCIVEEIGGTADLECGVLSKSLIAFESLAVESINQLPIGF
jgi:hypothetical protein